MAIVRPWLPLFGHTLDKTSTNKTGTKQRPPYSNGDVTESVDRGLPSLSAKAPTVQNFSDSRLYENLSYHGNNTPPNFSFCGVTPFPIKPPKDGFHSLLSSVNGNLNALIYVNSIIWCRKFVKASTRKPPTDTV